MPSQGVTPKIDILIIHVFDETVDELLQSAYGSMQQVKVEQWRKGTTTYYEPEIGDQLIVSVRAPNNP